MELDDNVGDARGKSLSECSISSSSRQAVDVIVADCSPRRATTPAQEPVPEPVDDLSEFCHPLLYKACRSLGMTEHAVRDWIALHDSPSTIASFFIAALLGLVCPSITFTYFHPETMWKIIVPITISMSSESLNVVFFWRYGPCHSQSRICQVLLLLWAGPLVGSSVAVFFGPESETPFNSKPGFTGIVSALLFCAVVTCKAGRISTMRLPRLSSVQSLVLESLCLSIRIMDILTSIYLVSGVVDEVQRGQRCMWFGEEGKCGHLVKIAVAIALAKVLGVACCIVLVFIHRMQAPYGSPVACPRWAMLVHVTRIISEFVVLIAILVKLFSDTRIGAAPGIATPPTEALMSPPPPSPPPPPPPANTSVPHAGVSVPMLLISLAFSIATGVLSILATGSMVQLMGIPVSATSSGTSVWSRMQRSSHGTDAPRSLVPRRGFPVALGGANRVAPES